MTPPLPPLRHQRRPFTTAEEGTGEVDVNHALPLGQRHLLHQLTLFHLDQHAIAQNAGAVDKTVQHAKTLLDSSKHGLDLGFARHIADKQLALTILIALTILTVHQGGGRLQIGAIDVEQRQRRTLYAQGQRNGPSQATSSAGNNDDLIFDIHQCSL